MPRNFCFVTTSDEFVRLARELNVSVQQLDMYASVYTDRFGKTYGEMKEALWGDARMRDYRDFRAWLKGRVGSRRGGGRSLGNVFDSRDMFKRAEKVWTYYNGRRLDTISHAEFALLMSILPEHEVYYDSEGVKRVAFEQPRLDYEVSQMSREERERLEEHPVVRRFLRKGEEVTIRDFVTQVPLGGRIIQSLMDAYGIDYGSDVFSETFGSKPGELFYEGGSNFAALVEEMADETGGLCVTDLLERYVTNRIGEIARGEVSREDAAEMSEIFGMNMSATEQYDIVQHALDSPALQSPARETGRTYTGSDVYMFPNSGTVYELTAHDKDHINKLLSVGVSHLLDRLTGPDGAAYMAKVFPGESFPRISNMHDRSQWLEVVGIERLLGVVRRQMFDNNPNHSFEASVKWAMFSDERHWNENILGGLHRYKENENVSFDELKTVFHLNDREISDVMLAYALEHGDEEMYSDRNHKVSTIAGLPADIRRFFNTLFVRDAEGGYVADREGYGVPDVVEGRSVLCYMYDNFMDCTTRAELLAAIEEKRHVRGMADLLERMRTDERFAIRIFSNFDKVRLAFSVNGTEVDENGVARLLTHDLAVNQVSDHMYDRVRMNYLMGINPLFKNDASGARVVGRGVTDQTQLTKLKSHLSNANESLAYIDSHASDSADYWSHIDRMERNVMYALSLLGMPDFDINVVRMALYTDYNSFDDVTDLPVYGVLRDLQTVADAFDTAPGVVYDMPLVDDELAGSDRGRLAPSVALKRLCYTFCPLLDDVEEPYAGRDGSSWYTVGNKTALTNLMKQLDPRHQERMMRYLNENFGRYRFHVMDGNIENLTEANWLRTCQRIPFEVHQVVDTDHVRYKDYSRPEMAVSLFSQYQNRGATNGAAFYSIIFGDRDGQYAIQGPKYALEDIEHNGFRCRGSMQVAAGVRELMFSEILRMKAVWNKCGEFVGPDGKLDESKMTDAFDSVPEDICKESAKDPRERRLTRELLVKDGRLTTSQTGLSFRFVEELNSELVDPDSALGDAILAFINDEGIDENDLNERLTDAALVNMDKMVDSQFRELEGIGIFDAVPERESPDGLPGLRYLDQFIEESRGDTMGRVGGDIEAYRAERRRMAEEFLREFLWNDYYATSQIYKMTISDLAYFKTTEKAVQYSKNLTSPGRTMDPTARDRNGVRYSDGKMRTVYIDDNIVQSAIKPNVERLYESLIEAADRELKTRAMYLSDEREAYLKSQKEAYTKMLADARKGYSSFNATDGQSYSCVVGTRKKLGCIGEWTDEMEDAFGRVAGKIARGESPTFDDLDMMIQVIKPITFTFEDRKYGTDAMDRVKQLSIYKTSEIMLARAGSMLDGGDNVLMALNDIMLESAYDKDGNYTGAGIDTIIFRSGVKSGASNVISLDGCRTYDEAKERLRAAIYDGEGNYTGAVHVTPLEAYTFQQENPAELEDHYQQMGSQGRAIVMSDIPDDTEVTIDGVTTTAGELRREYYRLLAENIKASFDDVARAFGLPGDRDIENEPLTAAERTRMIIDRNEKISDLLRNACLKDQKFDWDLWYACGLDSRGQFNVPLNDIVIGQKVMNLVNSVIRNKVNKQKMPGGPVVQMSGAFFSEDLNVRFKDRDGNLLMTFREFCLKNGMSAEDFNMEVSALESDSRTHELTNVGKRIAALSERYKSEVLKGDAMHGVAYFEVRLNIADSELKDALRKPDGTFMTPDEAIKAGIIDEDALKVIAERIPTEDKYSMIPMRIVGFNADQSGEYIVMPKEITLLTGSDFDVDKMYCSLKELVRTLRLKGGDDAAAVEATLDAFAQRWVDEVFDTDHEENDAVRDKEKELVKPELRRMVEAGGRNLTAVEGSRPRLARFFDLYQSEYCDPHFAANRNMRTEGGRMNRAFDIMMGMMTSSGSIDKLFNPGGFENEKRISNVMRIMRLSDYSAAKYGTFNDLMDKKVSELEEILERNDRLHPLLLSTKLHFQQENAAAKKMIGHAANNNTAHAFMQGAGIKANLFSKTDFRFAGRDANGMDIDPVHGINVGYVSKTLGSISAAAVDAPKYQTLKAMNFNEFTSNAYMLLIRMGFDEADVTLFMNLPSIREMSEMYAKAKNSGRNVRAEDIAQEYVRNHAADYGFDGNMLTDRTRANSYMTRNSQLAGRYMRVLEGSRNRDDLSGLSFTREDILKVYENGGSADAQFVNAMAVETFVRMSKLGDELFSLTHYTKLNSLNESIQSTLGSAVATHLQISALVEKYAPRMNPDGTENWGGTMFNRKAVWEFLKSNPLIRTFYETVYSEGHNAADFNHLPAGLAKQIFGDDTVYYNAGFRDALGLFIKAKKGYARADEIDDFANAYTQYALFQSTSEESPNEIFDASPERMEYFTTIQNGGFIRRAYQMMHSNYVKGPAGRNLLLRCMYVTSPTEACPVPTLDVRTGSGGVERVQDLKAAWLELYNSDESFTDEAGNEFTSKGFAQDLMAYAIMRDGIFGREDSLVSLIPAQMKHDVREYYGGLTKASKFGEAVAVDPRDFTIMYMRNRTDDRRIVPAVEVPEGRVEVRPSSVGDTYVLDPADATGLITSGEGTGNDYHVTYALVAMINGQVCINNSKMGDCSEPSYIVSSPLGIPGHFMEMNPSMRGEDGSFFDRFRTEEGLAAALGDFTVYMGESDSLSRRRDVGDSMATNAGDWMDLGGVINDRDMTRGEVITLSQIVRGNDDLLAQLRGEDDGGRQRRIIRRHLMENGIRLSNADRKELDRLLDKFC